MQINWTNIKAEILVETKAILQTEPNFNVNEVLDLFVKVLLYSISEADLSGIATRYQEYYAAEFLMQLKKIQGNEK